MHTKPSYSELERRIERLEQAESALKQAQEALRKSEEMCRLLLESGDEGILVIQEGKIRFLNPRGLAFIGYPLEEMLSRDMLTFIHPDDRGWIAPLCLAKLAGEDVPPGSCFRVIHKNGSVRWVQSRSTLLDWEGKPALLSFLTNVEDRKQAEEKYRLLVENAGEAIYVAQAGMLTFVNEKTMEISGYSEQELKSRPFIEFIHPDDRAMVLERHMRRQRGEDLPSCYPFRIVHRSGKIRWVELRVVAIQWEGKPATLNFLSDITERKQAEEALRESELFLKETQKIARLGGWKANPFTDYLAWTDGAYDIMEADPNCQPGFTEGLRFFLPDCAASIREKAIACMTTGEPFVLECQLVTESDKKLWTEFRGIAPVTEGERSYVIGTIQDITDRKQALQEDERLRAQFLQAQKMESVGRLAGGVAHDFNNSLQMILGYADLVLMKADKSERIHDEIEKIRSATTRATNIVRQLLAFARKQTIEPETLDVNDTVGGMLKMLHRLIGEDIDLAWIPGPDLWQVRMDPSQADQILANLCVNARDAISGVGKIRVETCNAVLDRGYCRDHMGAVPGQYVLLAVGDDGCGMDRDVLAQIFEPFFTTKEAAKGTGLGLATVYGIVKQNNGYIEVQSEPGKGSVFKVFLPRHEGEEEGPSAAAAVSGDALTIGRETVLLVEDQGPVLELGRRLLVELGYTVLAASTPDEALRLAESYAGPIHLLLTDVVLPKMNGKDLASRLASLRPGLKCLFMSGHTADVIAHRGVIEKGVHFIQKPFSIKDLSAKVRTVLEQ